MATLRKTLFGILLILFVLIAIVFAYGNPEPIVIDIGFARLEGVSMTLAFAVAFALGWLFGLVSAWVALLRMAAERRRLRLDLKYAETELSSLRSGPLQDAD